MSNELNCHICGKPFTVIEGNLTSISKGGVTVRCENPDGCLPNENVCGYGKDAKAAANIASQKYKVSR